ncbi:MAG: LysR family transcriptional regulator [Lachnospiraceae bacterium]|nr:LysR family transcriptional regulator [Lachnospiraceae bacterium]
MNFQNLDYFFLLANEKSFTRTAKRLFITQQTLSGQIASLEKEIGHKLFIRSKPLELTEAGRILYSYTAGILRDYRKMTAELSLLNAQEANNITLGISYPRAIQRYTRLIKAVQKFSVLGQIRFVQMPGDDLVELLRTGSIDVAIAHFPENDPAFITHPIFEEEIVLLATDELLQNTFGGATEAVIQELKTTGRFSLLRNCPYVKSKRNNTVAHFADRFMEEHIPAPVICAESDSFDTQLAICRTGAAFSFFPKSITADILQNDDLAPFRVFTLGSSSRFMIHYGYLKESPRRVIIEEYVRLNARILEDDGEKSV